MIYRDTPFDIRYELRDPFHLDFRPCPHSRAGAMQVGAYAPWTPAPVNSSGSNRARINSSALISSVDSSSSSNSNTVYWIPGRQLIGVASTPVPPTGSVMVHMDTELMFNQARYGDRFWLGFFTVDAIGSRACSLEARACVQPNNLLCV
jgi:hypothetical protein